MKQLVVLGVPVHCADFPAAARELAASATRQANPPAFFVHMNAHNYFHLLKSPELAEDLRERSFLFMDGAGFKVAAWMEGLGWLPDLNGTDLFPLVMEQLADKGIPVYLLGGSAGVVQGAAADLAVRWPRIPIAGYRSGFFAPAAEAGIIDEINASGAKLLIIGRGFPLQERFALAHLHNLNVNVVWTVGGLFDFLSGKRPRAAPWVRKIRLEWLFRFMVDPIHLGRRTCLIYPWFILHTLRCSLRQRRGEKSIRVC